MTGAERADDPGDLRTELAWLRAAARVSCVLLSGQGREPGMWRAVAQEVGRIAGARTVTLCRPDPDDPAVLRVAAATGEGAEDLAGRTQAVAGSLAGEVLTARRGRVVAAEEGGSGHGHDADGGPVMAVPLPGAGAAAGVVVVSRWPGGPAFGPGDLRGAEEFAAQAAVALELARVRSVEHQLEAAAERERIAADLHDHVVQQLFATGLNLQSTAARVGTGGLRDRLEGNVAAIDETIRQIRRSIFNLQFVAPVPVSVHAAVGDVVADVGAVLAAPVELELRGDLEQPAALAAVEDLRAALRESLTNVARHAAASRVVVVVEATAEELVLLVEDDGRGLGDGDRRSGLTDLRVRAARRGGRLEVGPGPQGRGTRLRWSVALG